MMFYGVEKRDLTGSEVTGNTIHICDCAVSCWHGINYAKPGE